MYASESCTQIRTLKNSLYSLSRNNDSIADYMDRAKCLYDQLVTFGSPIIKDNLVDQILHVLGANYRPFTHNIEAKLAFSSFDDLFGLLVYEKLQLKSSSEIIQPPAVALYSSH